MVRPWLKRFVLVLGAVLLVSVMVAGLGGKRLGQGEETWHELALRHSVPATRAEWLATARQDQPRIEWRYSAKPGQLYLVRIYADRDYLAALHPGSSDEPPIHIASGRIGRLEWRKLRDLAEQMYPLRETLFQEDDNLNPADVRLTLVHDNRHRVLYKYHTADYTRLPELLRDFDAQLFEIMRSWTVKPHHGYAKPLVRLSYGVEAIPALLRGLESPRESLHGPVVERLVAIGQPALPELIRVLGAGEAKRYRPVSRYLAVLDGIGSLADPVGEGYSLVKALADGKTGTTGQNELVKRAQDLVDRFEIEAWLAERWTVSPETEALFGQRRLPPEQEAHALAEFRYRFNRGNPIRGRASEVLVAIGPDVLPTVLDELRRDRVESNYFNEELLEVLGTLGGREAFFFALREGVIEASACVQGLADLGAEGVAGLLALLDSGDRFARHRAAEVLAGPEYRSYTAEFGTLLESKLGGWRDLVPGAVRDLHKNAAQRLIEVIRTHGAPDDASLNAVVAAATDPMQDDRTRIVALEALAMLGPRAASSVPRLQAVAGYASGRVHQTLERTLATLSIN